MKITWGPLNQAGLGCFYNFKLIIIKKKGEIK
jgi:hypothetical protein